MSVAAASSPAQNQAELRESVLRHARYSLGVPLEELAPREAFRAVALAVRDLMVERLLATEQRYRRADAKRVYYLSMEFLIGRSLHNNLVNLGLHAANVVLLFLVLAWLTGGVWRSAAVAALFALHPLNVESVAWVAERKNLLSTFFWILTIAAHGWYARRPGAARYLAVAAGTALALLSKPMAVTLPLVLLLLDFWPLGRMSRGTIGRLVLEKLPLLVLAGLTGAITLQAHLRGGSVVAIEAIPPAERHLVTHEGHLVRLTAVDEEAVALAVDLLPQFTFSGTAEQLRTRVAEYEAGGVTELVYQPAGPDLTGELERVMDAVGSASS